jgi:hypothetical protein
MDKETIAKLRPQIVTALEAALGPAYTVEAKRATFDATFVDIKIRIAESDGVSPDELEFNRYADSEGLEGAFGATVEHQGKTYTICGFRPRASKRPVIVERADGKKFLFDVDGIRRLLGRAS